MADITLTPLNQGELDFVTNQVNNTFLHNFGTSQGYGMFCSVAKQQGFKCAGGPQAKGSYATYLKNAKAGNTSLFSQMTSAYNNLDGFTKAAMAKKIVKGKALQSKTFNTGCFTKFTVAELHEIASLAGVKVSGNKANVCSQLSASGVDLAGLWGQSQNITINPKQKQTGQAGWQAYARKTKKRAGAIPRTYAGMEAYAPSAIPLALAQQNGALTPAEKTYIASLNGSS